ncbi:MAG: LysR substrate-binding domain-containing protein [Pseudomonadota bacterium]
MDLRWLDDILVLLEEKNMTRAAERQNITQPAFSRRIKNFEDWVGETILERGKNSIRVKAALKENEIEIRALLDRVDRLKTLIRNFDPKNITATVAAHHAPIHSVLPEMLVYAKTLFPSLRLNLRAGDLDDCVSIFLRGDADMLLCFEAEDSQPLPFGEAVSCTVCGRDQLIPVIGGALRYQLRSDGSASDQLPAITYPASSAFGRMLRSKAKPFGTTAFSKSTVCETAFSTGVKDLVLSGLGVAWLPASMGYHELERGDLVSLARQFGRVPLRISLYTMERHEMAAALANAWASKVELR